MSNARSISLIDLPNELLAQIFECVSSQYHEKCKAFSAIARVNRSFNSLITPSLYSNFRDCCAKHLQLFGRTVLSNKTCAELVKHYEGRHGRGSDLPDCPNVWHVFVLDETLKEAVVKRLPGLPSPITPAVFSYALTCILPGLQRVDVTSIGNLLMKQLSRPCTHVTAPFQRLGNLRIATEPDRTYEMHDVALLFMLPSLSTLTIDMAALNTREEQTSAPIDKIWHCRPRSSTIRELILERCGLPPSWIAAMVASCKTLKHFHHEHYYWDNNAEYYPSIYQSLTEHQETLSYVRMNEVNGCKLDAARQSDPLKPLSFQHFTSLAYLDIPLFTFASRTQHCPIDRLLPPSLQVLTLDLRSAREGFSDGFFISLAETARAHVPRLKSVEIICRIEEYHEDGYLPLHFCHLRRMFSKYGIELSYFLEFVQCEFKAGKFGFHFVIHTGLTIFSLHGTTTRQYEGFGPRWM